MANLIITIEDAYRSFLNGIRKVSTTTVRPEVFDMFFNDAATEWLLSKLPHAEFNQKRIDDLENLRVVCDGDFYPLLAPVSTNVFRTPSIFDQYFSGLPADTQNSTGSALPLYLHGLNALFVKGTETFMAKIMRSDQRGVSYWNSYHKVSADRPYYEFVAGKIRLMGRDADYLRLEYIRWFKVASYANSIEPEFKPEQNSEIIQIAVRTFLENRTNPRYKSKLQEMMIRSQAS